MPPSAAPITLGLRVSLCGLEFSVYCGSCCPTCAEASSVSRTAPYLFAANGSASTGSYGIYEAACFFNDRVRRTSVILLLGVGSFVCYRLYRRLKHRLEKKRTAPGGVRGRFSAERPRDFFGVEECYSDGEDESELSDSYPIDDRNASFGDADSSSSCSSLSDAQDVRNMGVGPSNPYEPVHFDRKSEDVRFHGNRSDVPASSPLDIRGRDSVCSPSSRTTRQMQRPSLEKRPKGLGDENRNGGPRQASGNLGHLGTSFDSASFDADGAEAWDTDSLQANFSVGSLAERSRKTEELLAALSAEDDDNFSANDPPSDSVLVRLRSVCSLRRMSVESEVSDASLFDAAHVESSCEAFATMDRLESILLDTKRELLDLDAELVGLKAFWKPRVSLSDNDNSVKSVSRRNSLVDVVGQHKLLVKSRGLLEESATEEKRDSGSDFGNSLESDGERAPGDSLCASLEWDSASLPGVRESNSADSISEITSDVCDLYVRGALREEIRRAINSDCCGRMTRSRTLPADWLLKRDVSRSVSGIGAVRGGVSDSNGNPLPWSDTKDSGYDSVYGDIDPPVGKKVTLADYVTEACKESPWRDRDGEYLVSVLRDLDVGTARRIRMDSYSTIRAVAFGVLAHGCSMLARHGGAQEVYQKLYDVFSSEEGSWLARWHFCPWLGYNGNVSCLEGFWDCLSFLQAVEDQLCETDDDRESVLAAIFNRDPALDARIVEAVRLLLLRSALELYENPTKEAVLSSTLFSQNASKNPQEFLLDAIGTKEGTNEVELCLLGYALKTTLIVVRLGQTERNELVHRYTDRKAESRPQVVLAELDGCYCIFGR